MKRLPILSFLVFIFLLSCEKPETKRNQTCCKGRYIETGCWPVIQLLDHPADVNIPTGRYGDYEHAFGTGDIPEQYKDGRTFYFTVTSIDSNRIYMTYCLPTRYFIGIGAFSDSACDQITK